MSKKKRAPLHPGEVLVEEFLKPMELSQNRLALDMVRFLLERGANASVPNDSDWATPLYWAKKGDNTEIRKLLEQHLPSR